MVPKEVLLVITGLIVFFVVLYVAYTSIAETLEGPSGDDGADGKQGKTGKAGKDGVQIGSPPPPALFANQLIYTDPNNLTYTFTVPAGITKIKIELVGGGGGGNGGASTGGGGGGGAYLMEVLTVAPGDVIGLIVGAGGKGGLSTGGAGQIGGTTLFFAPGLPRQAGGGDGGTNTSAGTGGIGFSPGTVYLIINGARGGNWTTSAVGTGGDSGGRMGTGGVGGVTDTPAAGPGVQYGGGGGAGYDTGFAGGDGASGVVIVSW